MKCPKCGNPTNVYDSRQTNDGTEMRRRRQCIKCGHRFTTYEMNEIQVARMMLAQKFYEKYKREEDKEENV